MDKKSESAGNQVFMDLGDFVPDVYELRFSINEHQYAFHFGEASVDEVLRMMLTTQIDDVYLFKRRIVTQFLQKHVTQGDANQLETDLKLVPFKSSRGALDIASLSEIVEGRVKKKQNGESQKTSPTLFGSLVKSLFSSRRAKAL